MLKSSLAVIAALTTLTVAFIPNGAQAQSRRAYCDDYARQVAWRQGNPDNVVGGALTGAIIGGGIGAITGNGAGSNIATGLGVGALAGGALGAASGSGEGYISRNAYYNAFNTCMDAGYGVREAYPAYRPRFRGGDAEEYCAARYRSYNPDTGMYLSRSGRYRPCP